jgi:hypothetical protein
MPAARSRTTSTRSAERLGGESGAGLLGSVIGVTVFLVLLLFAVQLAMNLYATSAVTSVAFDAARKVAGADHVAPATAEADARRVLDEFEAQGGKLTFDWDDTRDDVVVLRLEAKRPAPLLAKVSFPFQTIDRTVRVRREGPR